MHLSGIYRTFVVGVCYSPKTLLSSGVPNLKFDVFVVGVDCLEAEVDTNCGHVVFVELIVCEPK